MKREGQLDRLLGIAARALQDGRIVDALDTLLDAEKAAPRSATVYALRAEAHVARGAAADAIIDLSVAARHAGDDSGPARRLADLLSRYTLDDPTELDRRGLLAALARPGVAQAPIAAAALALWWRKDVPEDVRTATDPTQAAARVLGRRVAPCLAEPVLHVALRGGILTDAAIERFLTAVRARLLADGPAQLMEDRARAELALALLSQLMDNEHIWVETATETAKLQALAVSPEEIVRQPVESSGRFLLRALYRPLSDVPSAPLDDAAAAALVPKALRTLVATRRADAVEEKRIAATIPALGALTDDTSTRVAAQYESSPYPRWRSLHAPPAGRARQIIGRIIGTQADPFQDRPIRVLVAGAGTGQQALSAAIGYGPAAAVTALDLSRASLAYGARMARTLGIADVNFLQGDILALPTLGDTFDVIECIGVLHHMADPLAGWRALLARLAPGGLMYIGLYSALARREIAALRSDDPQWPGAGADADAARAYRAALLARPEGAPGAGLRRSHDFYAASDFRDLVLHAHETPVTVPELVRWLETLELEFLGFTLPGEILDDFRRVSGDPRRLADWDAYERAHPHTFDGMYCFWCRRIADGDRGA